MTQYATIDAQTLKSRLDAGEDLTLVETLDPPYFRKAHLPGAINIPTDQIAQDAPRQLDPDDTIVVYCANTECSASPRAAEELARMGYKRVIDFEAGKQGWEEAGFELEK